MKNSDFQIVGMPIIKKFHLDITDDFNAEDFNTNKIKTKIENEIANMGEHFCTIKQRVNLSFDKIESPFSLEVIALGKFEWNDKVLDEDLPGLIVYNTAAAILSFIRPLISSNLIYSGLPPYVIPLINFYEKENEEIEEEVNEK